MQFAPTHMLPAAPERFADSRAKQIQWLRAQRDEARAAYNGLYADVCEAWEAVQLERFGAALALAGVLTAERKRKWWRR